MEIFSTVSAAIDLGLKIAAAAEQVGQNRNQSAALSSDIVNSLQQIETFLKHRTSGPSVELCDAISQYEHDLRRILRHLERSTQQTNGNPLHGPTSRIKQLYTANDIKTELVELRQKVQTCHQNLQTSCTIKIDSEVTTMNQQISAIREEQVLMDRKIQMILEALVPGSSPERTAVLNQVEENMQERLSVINCDGTLPHDLVGVQSIDNSEATPSIRSARFSLRSFSSQSLKSCSFRSFSTSFIEKTFLKGKVKELARTIPQVHQSAFKHPNLMWLNPFRGLESDVFSSPNREDSIRETLRILKLLKSGRKISYVDAAKDLLCLGGALRDLGMQEQADVIHDWGVQICCELGAIGSPRTLVGLAEFLHKLSVELDNRQLVDHSQKVLKQAVRVRCKLEEQGWNSHLARLEGFLREMADRLVKPHRLGACIKIMEEAVKIARYLIKADRQIYITSLAISLHKLALFLKNVGQHKDAVVVGEEAVGLYRELAKRDHKAYLHDFSLLLQNLSQCMYQEGRYVDAVEIGKEAVKWYRALLKEDRRPYLSELSLCLGDLANILDRMGSKLEAKRARKEAVKLHRELVERDWSAYYLEHDICAQYGLFK
ncbi:hypothetical protein FRC03_009195 [Tulasnella sp. 419]|nr:hypothetical protein FRC03_009195 [Tulasnella sp. 419]